MAYSEKSVFNWEVLTMKRFLLATLAGIAGWLANSSVVMAGQIGPGDTTTSIGATDKALELTTPAPVVGFIVEDTGVIPYAIGTTSSGTVRELVVADKDNPLGKGDLTFLFQVHVATGEITRLTTSNYAAAVLTYVGFDAALSPFIPTDKSVPAGTRSPSTADRLGLGLGVGFNFSPAILAADPDTTSVALIVRTNATFVDPGTIGLRGSTDGGVFQTDGWAPALTPEPASVVLLGFGAAGVLGYGWKRGKVVA
jgi:hypothetical protein